MAASNQSISGPDAAVDDPVRLKGVCPDTVVVQTSWFPAVEQNAGFNLVGPSPRFDKSRKATAGPLTVNGVDTGVRIEVRAGGPAIGFQHPIAQLYTDTSITLAEVSLDEAILNSAKLRTLAVIAPFDIDPQVIMWSPEKHPEWRTIKDIGNTDTQVLYYQDDPYMDYLVGTGILHSSQIDGGFNGSPDRFVASGGAIAQQGYATHEPYVWEHEVKQWNRPIRYSLVHETGYPNYPDATLVIRAGERERLAPCLKRLVPMIQRAEVSFMRDAGPTSSLVVDAVAAYGQGFSYSPGVARYTVETIRAKGLISNGTYTPDSLGDLDPARVQRMIDILTPIAAAKKQSLKPGLELNDVFTNDYIDESIGLP